MSHWIITKRSRDSRSPYSGQTCVAAGVRRGEVYTDRRSAESDAEELSKHNPVGFVVQEYEPAPEDN